tara:strand:- start:604 stop:921 length:318 start_codon:yes stop_codon:yes gene_type:complete
MDKELVKAFVAECKQDQEWKQRWKDNHIDMNDYFKYSGKVEATKILISRYNYNINNSCNELHEQYIKKENYEKLWEKYGKGHPGRFSQEVEAYNWETSDDGIWSD